MTSTFARIVLTFGLISGGIMAIMMAIMVPLYMSNRVNFENGEVIGYTTMVVAFIFIFLGIRAERERQGGWITFGRAFKVGILIVLIASLIYVATWQVVYYGFFPNFMDHYADFMIEKMRAKGATAAAIQAEVQKMDGYKRLYGNPIINIGMTFLEVFPVGLIVSLVAAAILRRRPGVAPTAPARA
jgi:hypothetical protein